VRELRELPSEPRADDVLHSAMAVNTSGVAPSPIFRSVPNPITPSVMIFSFHRLKCLSRFQSG
jgi:hypothetical protein